MLTSDHAQSGVQTSRHLSCIRRGTLVHIRPGSDVYEQMDAYFAHLYKLEHESRDVLWTLPYIDADGLGLMLSATKSVYSQKTGQ